MQFVRAAGELAEPIPGGVESSAFSTPDIMSVIRCTSMIRSYTARFTVPGSPKMRLWSVGSTTDRPDEAAPAS